MKNCIDCGCLMPDDHEGDVCECCRDGRGDTIPDVLRREEAGCPRGFLTTFGPVREALDRILESRLAELVDRDLSDKPVDRTKFNPYLF